MALATLSIDLVAKVAKLEQDMGGAVRVAEKSAAQIEGAFANAAKFIGGLGIAGVVTDQINNAFNIVKGIDALNDLKDATGASIENLSALEDVAARTGTTMDTVGTAVLKLNKFLADADPGSANANMLKQLGLDAEALRQADPAEALRTVSVALSNFADDGNKGRFILDVLGKSIKDVAPLLNDLATQGKLVSTVTTEQAAEAEKFNQQLDALAKNSLDAKRALLSDLLPAINETVARFKEGAREGKSFYRVIYEGQLDLLGLKSQESSDNRADRIKALTELLKDQSLAVERRARLEKQLGDLTAKTAAVQPRAFRPSDNYGEAFKPSLPASKPGADPKAARDAIDPSIKAYEKLIARVTERASVAQLELDSGRRVTESQRLGLDTVLELAKAENQFSDTQKRSITVALERSVATIAATEAQREQNKALQEASRSVATQLQAATDNNEALRQQLEEVGKSVEQIDALREARLQDAVAAREQRLATIALFDPTSELIAQEQLLIDTLKESGKARKGIKVAESEAAGDPTSGAQAAITEYLKGVEDSAAATKRAVGGLLSGVEDQLTSLFTTGKADAKGLINSLIAEFTRLAVVKPLVAGLLGDGTKLAGLFGQLFTPSTGGGLGSLLSAGASLFGFAKGGVFDSPHLFKFADGGALNTGVLGEAGPEAIMPLKRGPGGRLGVVASGGGGGPAIDNSGATYNIGSGVSRSEVQAAIQRANAESEARIMRRLRNQGGA